MRRAMWIAPRTTKRSSDVLQLINARNVLSGRVLTVPAIATPKRPRLMLALGLGLSMALAAGPAHQALAFGAPDSFADLAQQISPSVVNITTSSMVAQATDGGPMVPPGSPF